MMVDAIERALKVEPRTSELRRERKRDDQAYTQAKDTPGAEAENDTRGIH